MTMLSDVVVRYYPEYNVTFDAKARKVVTHRGKRQAKSARKAQVSSKRSASADPAVPRCVPCRFDQKRPLTKFPRESGFAVFDRHCCRNSHWLALKATLGAAPSFPELSHRASVSRDWDESERFGNTGESVVNVSEISEVAAGDDDDDDLSSLAMSSKKRSSQSMHLPSQSMHLPRSLSSKKLPEVLQLHHLATTPSVGQTESNPTSRPSASHQSAVCLSSLERRADLKNKQLKQNSASKQHLTSTTGRLFNSPTLRPLSSLASASANLDEEPSVQCSVSSKRSETQCLPEIGARGRSKLVCEASKPCVSEGNSSLKMSARNRFNADDLNDVGVDGGGNGGIASQSGSNCEDYRANSAKARAFMNPFGYSSFAVNPVHHLTSFSSSSVASLQEKGALPLLSPHGSAPLLLSAEKGVAPRSPVASKIILFTFGFEPSARPSWVAVAGSFTRWAMRHPLHFDRSRQLFVARLALKPGRHMYKFIVDGQWRCRKDCPVELDVNGVENNVIIVL